MTLPFHSSRLCSISLLLVIGALLPVNTRISFASTPDAAEAKSGLAEVRVPFNSLPDAPIPNVVSTVGAVGSLPGNEANNNLVVEFPMAASMGA